MSMKYLTRVNEGTSKYYTTDKAGINWEVVDNRKTENFVVFKFLCQLVIDKLVFVPENELKN